MVDYLLALIGYGAFAQHRTSCMSLACYRVEFLCCYIVYTAARVDCVTSQFRNRVYTVEVDQAKYAYRHRNQEVRLHVPNCAQPCATVHNHASQLCVAVRLLWPCCYFLCLCKMQLCAFVYMHIVCCVQAHPILRCDEMIEFCGAAPPIDLRLQLPHSEKHGLATLQCSVTDSLRVQWSTHLHMCLYTVLQEAVRTAEVAKQVG